jgi:hypothetical protein
MTAGPTERAQIDQALADARAADAELVHAQYLLDDARRRWRALQSRVHELEQIAHDERRDVERLDGRGPLALFYSLLGPLEERRDRERQEMVAAALKLDEARAERALLDGEIATLDARVGALLDAPLRVKAALARKEQWLRDNDGEAARALAAIADEEAALGAELHRIAQATTAAGAAAHAVEGVQGNLGQAADWTVVGLVMDQIPGQVAAYQYMDEACQQIPALQTHLGQLDAGCASLGLHRPAPAVPTATAGLAGDFMDNLVTAWSSSSSLDDTRAAVDAAGHHVAQSRLALDRRERAIRARLADLAVARGRLLGTGAGEVNAYLDAPPAKR